jgi:hypothetical protein
MTDNNNKFSSAKGGKRVCLEKDGKNFPVVLVIKEVEKSLTSASYLGGHYEVNKPDQVDSSWKIESYRVGFPKQGRHFRGLVLGIIGSLLAISILGVVGWYFWKKKPNS